MNGHLRFYEEKGVMIARQARPDLLLCRPSVVTAWAAPMSRIALVWSTLILSGPGRTDEWLRMRWAGALPNLRRDTKGPHRSVEVLASADNLVSLLSLMAHVLAVHSRAWDAPATAPTS